MELAEKVRRNLKLLSDPRQLRGSTADIESVINSLFEQLHEITEQQDLLNLTIRDKIMNDKDPRWLPIHIIDDANAIILEISLAYGNPTYLGYIQEKADALSKKVFQLGLRKVEFT